MLWKGFDYGLPCPTCPLTPTLTLSLTLTPQAERQEMLDSLQRDDVFFIFLTQP